MSITRLRLAFGFVVCALPAAVDADTIRLTYRIDVTETCSTATGSCSTVPKTFPLVLSFDSAVTRSVDFPGDGNNEERVSARYFGEPTFSFIPLERPPVTPGMIERNETVHSAVQSTSVGWTHYAIATRTAYDAPDFTVYWELTLLTYEELLEKPDLSVSTFRSFLGNGPYPTSFQYSFYGGPNDVVRYTGTAVLLDSPTPVPEPISFLLVGSGLCGFGALGWRRQRARTVTSSRQG